MADSRKWWTKETVAVVTGGNKGVGYEIARQLGKHGLTVILTARDEDKGQNAADTLKAKGLAVHFHQLDVTDSESVQTFAIWVKTHLGGINILVNNAGISRQEVNFENAREVIATNFVSVKMITAAFMPLFRNSVHGARIVNITSTRGALNNVKDESLREQLGDIENLKQEQINSLAANFLQDVSDGKCKTEDWKWAAQNVQYTESKAFLNAYTRVLAKSLEKPDPDDQKIFANVVSPGLTKSDLIRSNSLRQSASLVRSTSVKGQNCDGHSTEHGADTPVWLALMPREGYPNGKFFMNREELEF